MAKNFDEGDIDPSAEQPEEVSDFDIEPEGGGGLWIKIVVGVLVAIGLASIVMYVKGIGPFAPEPEPVPPAASAPASLPAPPPAPVPPPVVATPPPVKPPEPEKPAPVAKSSKKAPKGKKKHKHHK